MWVYCSPQFSQAADDLHAGLARNGGAILLDCRAPDGGTTTHAGRVRGVTTDAAVVVPAADVIIFSVTGPDLDALARELAPHLRHTQALLYLPGQGCFNFLQLCRAMDAVGGRALPRVAATRTLPW